MELCLNALWFAVSLLLVGFWLRDAQGRGRRPEVRAGIAVVLLIVLLFPAISMTDDLLLQSAPAETEHLLRRVEVSLEHTLSLAGTPVFLAILLLVMISVLCCLMLERPTVRRRRWCAALLRTAGVRPPPMLLPSLL